MGDPITWENVLRFSQNGGLSINGNKVFHAGNDGPGSSLSADYLDNLDSSQFLRSDSNDTANGIITFNAGLNVGANHVLNHNSTDTRDKIRVWNNGLYSIGMQNGVTYGSINNDFAMTFQMSNSNSRGFWWGDSSHSTAQGAMSLSTDGKLTVASAVRVGYGQGDTVVPGSFAAMDINGHLNIASGNNLVMGYSSGSDIDSLRYDDNTNTFHFVADSGAGANGNARVQAAEFLGDLIGTADTATKWSNARTLTLGGDLSGNVSFDGSSNFTLNAQVANDSHNHDGRYYTKTYIDNNFYTKSQADARYVKVGDPVSDSDKLDGLDSTDFQRLNYIDTSNAYLFRHRNSNNPVAYFNQTGTGDIARFYKGANANDTNGTSATRILNDGSVYTTGQVILDNSLYYSADGWTLESDATTVFGVRSGGNLGKLQFRKSDGTVQGEIYFSDNQLMLSNGSDRIVDAQSTITRIWAGGTAGLKVSAGEGGTLLYQGADRIKATSYGSLTTGEHQATRFRDSEDISRWLEPGDRSQLETVDVVLIRDLHDPQYYLDLADESRINDLSVRKLQIGKIETIGSNGDCTNHLDRGRLAKDTGTDGVLVECTNKTGVYEWSQAGSRIGWASYDAQNATYNSKGGVIQGVQYDGGGVTTVTFGHAVPIGYLVSCSNTSNTGSVSSNTSQCAPYDLTSTGFKLNTSWQTGGGSQVSIKPKNIMIMVHAG